MWTVGKLSPKDSHVKIPKPSRFQNERRTAVVAHDTVADLGRLLDRRVAAGGALAHTGLLAGVAHKSVVGCPGRSILGSENGYSSCHPEAAGSSCSTC